MARQDVLMIGDGAYSWRQLYEMRKAQLAASRAAQGRQLALFELKEDCRPKAERTAAGRYSEPSLLPLMSED